MTGEHQARTAALAERLTAIRRRSETLPGAPLVQEVLQSERDLGGGLIAGGVAFRMFLWLVPFGLVVAAVLSLWSDHDEQGLESAARELGVGAAAAHSAGEALQQGDRSAAVALALGLGALAWFTLSALRALALAHALAWHVTPPRIRRPVRPILLFNGLFLAATLSSVVVAWLHEHLGSSALLSIALTFTTTAAVALSAMWLLPHRAARPSELLPGAVLVAGGYQAVQVAVLFYFAPKLGSSEETYGAFGAAATMLVWLYALSRLITVGAFLNATLWARRQAKRGAASPW